MREILAAGTDAAGIDEAVPAVSCTEPPGSP